MQISCLFELKKAVVNFKNVSLSDLCYSILQWLMPNDGGILEPDHLEKTYRFSQRDILTEVDLLSSRKPFDMILPGKSYEVSSFYY